MPADPLASLFLICFLAGAALVVLTFVSGVWAAPLHHLPASFRLHLPGGHIAHAAGGHVGHTGHLGAGHPTHIAGHATDVTAAGHGSSAHSHAADDGASPFNTMSILTFVTWFGGVGYLLRTNWSIVGWLIVLLATLAGIGAGGAVFLFLARVLLPNQTILDPHDYERVGTVARTTMSIREGGTGEIVYTQGGARHVDAARSEQGDAIEHGTEVVIVRFERGVAYVEPWQQFLERSEHTDH